MGEENRSLLEEEIKAEIKRLGSLESGSQEHTTAVDSLTKLYKLKLEEDMCDASTAVSIIQRYVDEHLFSPSFTWPKYEFRKRSYQQWAAYEICDRIMDKPFDDPITVIENFMFEMAMYACYGEDEQRMTKSQNT